MGRNIVETIVGALVLLVAGVFVFYAFAKSDRSGPNGYEVSARFDRIDGLKRGADVTVSGVKVGSVTGFDQFSLAKRRGVAPEVPHDRAWVVGAHGCACRRGASTVDRPGGRNLWCLPIRSRHLQPLVRTAVSLPGPTMMTEVALWRRASVLGAALAEAPAADGIPPVDLGGVRAPVGAVLNALAWRIEEALPQAMKAAPQAWDRVDDLLTFFDPALIALVGDVRRGLESRAASSSGAVVARAVALEGLLVIEAACGLARLCERRLSSLIRLRVRSGENDLLPGGRPFLDLAAALKEAARAWA